MKQNNEIENIKLQMLDEMQRSVRMQKANKDLYDYLLSTIQYVMEYAQRHKIPLPSPKLSDNLKIITDMIDQLNSHKLEKKSHLEQPTGNRFNNYRRGNSTQKHYTYL